MHRARENSWEILTFFDCIPLFSWCTASLMSGDLQKSCDHAMHSLFHIDSEWVICTALYYILSHILDVTQNESFYLTTITLQFLLYNLVYYDSVWLISAQPFFHDSEWVIFSEMTHNDSYLPYLLFYSHAYIAITIQLGYLHQLFS